MRSKTTDSDLLKKLFKPFNVDIFDFNELLLAFGIDKKQYIEFLLEIECTKSADESCANFDCVYNFVDLHADV